MKGKAWWENFGSMWTVNQSEAEDANGFASRGGHVLTSGELAENLRRVAASGIDVSDIIGKRRQYGPASPPSSPPTP